MRFEDIKIGMVIKDNYNNTHFVTEKDTDIGYIATEHKDSKLRKITTKIPKENVPGFFSAYSECSIYVKKEKKRKN